MYWIKMAQYWYMLVTADKYELPLTPPMRCCDLARLLGVNNQDIHSQTTPANANRYNGARTGRKFIRFLSEELDEMEKEK